MYKDILVKTVTEHLKRRAHRVGSPFVLQNISEAACSNDHINQVCSYVRPSCFSTGMYVYKVVSEKKFIYGIGITNKEHKINP